ncbi:hypothetical protein LNO75_03850 [Mycoplasma sp. T363T]|uniref:Vmc-like lipoprotein signal peptide domain-containing protein n=1 Tax=Mycoplasma bradburyae TaxID=2963128 RepID=UPI002341CEBB|nr:hypothetical protein [Mycoplasma bradburyae]MDC4163692.1 hypothetical protein [Mycoplasma bradburyae]
MKQKTKKLLQLSFSLGFLATTALVATSCNQPKTVTPKPTNPMQPGNGSGSETTTPGSGSGTTTPDNSEAKNQLDAVINTKDTNLALYSDYSMIKSELINAYDTAKSVSDKANVSKEELTTAKATLDAAINKAKTDKATFDKEHKELVDAYNELKTNLKTIDLNASLASIGDNYIYSAIKSDLNQKYTVAKTIIDSGVQIQDLNKQMIDSAKEGLSGLVESIKAKKDNVDQYTSFKLFKISDGKFEGDFKYKKEQSENQKLVSFSANFDNSNESYQWKTAHRLISGETKEKSIELTNVQWIYSLDTETSSDMQMKTQASYSIEFDYYGESATLYFPYKARKNDEIGDNAATKLSLKYKLNNKDQLNNIDVSKAKVDSIEIAKVNLTDLNFGKNKITFITENNKDAPMIGNMYIASTDTTFDAVYNDIFGNETSKEEPNKVTVNFLKGYGLANKGYGVTESTFIKKMNSKLDSDGRENQVEVKEYFVLGYLGDAAGGSEQADGSNVKYYTFYVNAPRDGSYEISGIYNTGQDRGLIFWKDNYNASEPGKKAKFVNLNSGQGDWSNKVKSFNKTQKENNGSASLQLSRGLNKIIVSGGAWNSAAPNLGNVTFTFKEPTASENPQNA